MTQVTRFDIIAVSGENDKGKPECWLGCILEEFEMELEVQWFIKTAQALYDLTSQTSKISKETVICKGIHMKHMWNYDDINSVSMGTWKLITGMNTINALHEEKELEQNEFRGLPMKTYTNKVVQTMLWE